MKRNTRSYKSSEVALGYLLLSPVILLVGFLVWLRSSERLFQAFTETLHHAPVKFIGLGTTNVCSPTQLSGSLFFFTLGFTVVSVFLESVLGMFFALVINEKFKFRGIMRAVVLIPWAIPTIISAKLWQLMYNYNYGLLNYILVPPTSCSQPINWFGSPLVHLLQSSSLMCGRPHRSWLYFSWPDFKRFLIPCMKQPPLMAQV